MARIFIKPLWNVRTNAEPERTTLGVESVERRYGTGRGYCVTADSAREAQLIAYRYAHERKHGMTGTECVQLVEHRGVPVLMTAPRW